MMLKTSESIAEIANALSGFQSEVQDARKDAEGHHYRYATLPTVLQLIRPLMGKYGLSLVQFPIGDALNVGVVSRLMHVSGEWLEEEFVMGVTEARGMSMAQSAGSVLTYCRRYSAAAILGISQQDSDARVDEPEITPATEKQYEQINQHVAANRVSPRRLKWLQVEKNWNNLTTQQAATILSEIEGSNS
jgi:hypothetical protein